MSGDRTDELRRIVDEELRPSVNVDGGDISFERLDDDAVHIVAGAECAGCPRCGDDFAWWIANEIERRVGARYTIKLRQVRPYY